ncbi:uncharacterized protein LOC117104514 [Anneissia japonica]|uniref:uncharacterized protein LOC117104514 n=1 Tax=Anneissia japonica TaxID=1529436 RepID=UPI001425AD20|nr:uncharacterized protein LOC117104514 [Anneissia japonica]
MIWTVFLLLSCVTLAQSQDNSCPDMHQYDSHGAKAVVKYLTVEATPDSKAVTKRKVVLPAGSTLLQGMLVAQYEDELGEFRFETSYHAQYGHFMTSINGVKNSHPFYWTVYDADTNTPLSCGVDSTYPEHDEHFLWRYEECCTE